MIEALFSGNSYVATKQLLDATTARHEALAANLANVETPGYKRVDLPQNFQAEFARSVHSGQVGKMAMPGVVRDRSALSVGADGNNVQLDKELLALGNNSLQYDTLTEFASSSIKQLKVAISGRTL